MMSHCFVLMLQVALLMSRLSDAKTLFEHVVQLERKTLVDCVEENMLADDTLDFEQRSKMQANIALLRCESRQRERLRDSTETTKEDNGSGQRQGRERTAL